MITVENLIDIMPDSNGRVITYAPLLNVTMAEFSIDSPRRQAAFLAQIAHESGSLYYTREIASGSAYEGRFDLGNINHGDGIRFAGRGLLQATGRSMYEKVGIALGVDLLLHPELLEKPELATRSAGWIWTQEKNLNTLADLDQFGTITKKINGGFNGIDQRLYFWLRARQILGVKAL